jgi:aspartyl protease family protein
MNGNDALYGVAALMMLVMVGSALVARRPPLGQTVKYALAWAALIAVAFSLFALRGEFSAVGSRLKAELWGTPMRDGEALRIAIADDGHFWTTASVNGVEARFLVDSGASVTTISRSLATRAGLGGEGRRVLVQTANGMVGMDVARADSFAVGHIARSDFPIHVSDRDFANVLGMNYLSTLSGWRVEGRDLVLEP